MPRAGPSLLGVLLLGALASCGPAGDVGSTNAALVEDQYAYHVGVLAYLYGYPIVDRYRHAHNAALREAEGDSVTTLDPMRSLGFFEVLNLELRKREPGPGVAVLMAQFDAIGVGPASEFNQAALSPARKRGLERAIRDARAMLEAAAPGPDANPADLMVRAARYRAAVSRAADGPETRTGADSR